MTEKTKVIWDEALLKGAVVEEISRSRMTLRSKDGRCYIVYSVCYQCGDANLVVESSEAPPQRGV